MGHQSDWKRHDKDVPKNLAVEYFIGKKIRIWDPDENGLYPYGASTPLKATTNIGRPQVFYPTNNFISYYMNFFFYKLSALVRVKVDPKHCCFYNVSVLRIRSIWIASGSDLKEQTGSVQSKTRSGSIYKPIQELVSSV